MDPDIIAGGFTVLLIFFGIGGMVAIIKWANWMFHPKRLSTGGRVLLPESSSQDARLKALEIYRQLASEKLDVVKTAVAMGYKEDELAQLDKRLEALIGEDALKQVIRGETPLPDRFDFDEADIPLSRARRKSIEA